MLNLPLAGRSLFLAAALGLPAAPAASQTFRLVDPALTVDGRRVGVVGAPLVQEPFGALTLNVPGSGTYRVSDRPFAGARGVGQFDGTGLFFAVDGRSVRLRSAEPLLDGGGAATAFVRFDPTSAPGARGLARVAVADGTGSAGLRSGPDAASRPERPRRGPDSSVRPPDTDARRDADRLRAELDRVSAERRALALERDRLRAERDAAVDRSRAAQRTRRVDTDRPRTDRLGSQARWTRPGRDDAPVRQRGVELAAERDRIAQDRDRLAAERDQLVAARDRAEADRARLAADLDAASRRAARADAYGPPADAGRAQTETGRLRAEIVARDRALDALRIESSDRAARLAETDAALARVQRALIDAEAERDAAVATRDAALAERDRLLVQLADARAERDALALQVAVLQRERGGQRPDVGRRPADRPSELPAPASSGAVTADPIPRTPAATPRETSRGEAGATLPGFDLSRLRNPDVIRRRLDAAEYPSVARESRIEGDVLVLFQTDPDGRVIRTAVASPLGGGLDGLAEGIVREMVFLAPVVGGLPTGLRSQVVVRFEM